MATERKLAFRSVDLKVSWALTRPLKTMTVFLPDDTFGPVPKEYFDRKLPIKSADTIVVLCIRNHAPITAPIKGKTVHNVFKSLERGLHIKMRSSTDDVFRRIAVYSRIADFVDAKMRKSLTKKYEAGSLRPIDLLGDHVYYEGGLRRGKGGVWRYGLGS
jgi:hypothetical protein